MNANSPNLLPALLVLGGLVYAGYKVGGLTAELRSIGRASDTVSRIFGG